MNIETRTTTIPIHIINSWQGVVNVIADLLDLPCVMINRLEPPDLEVFRSNIGAENPFQSGTKMPLAGIYCETAAMKRHMVKVVDARKDPEWADSPTAKEGIYAYLGYPLMWPDGKIFGTICAVDTKERQWGERYETLFLAFKEAVEAHLFVVDTLEKQDRQNHVLKQALHEVNTLHGLLPICSSCKKIRDDKGYWNQIESYIGNHSEAKFSHGICPDCAKDYFPGTDPDEVS